MMMILFTSRWNSFLIALACWRLANCSPHNLMGEPLLWACLHISMITMRMASFKHMISSRCSSWTCTLFFHSSSCWCLEDTHEGSLHLYIQDILVIGSIPTSPLFGSLLEHIGHPWSSSLSSSSLCWCLEETHDISLHLILQDILAIGSIISWPIFGLFFE